jgi:chlorobactene glucosyltransferase
MALLYLVFFFLILRFCVTLFNFISNPKLTPAGKHYTDLVSILIPARNEEEDIIGLLQSIKNQNYQHFEVLILDDNSTDNTYEICTDFAKSDERFKVIKGENLPEGWLGKNFACCQLAKQAKGKYFMFIDADEIISNGLIDNVIHRMKIRGLSLLSLFTNQITVTIGEKLVVPLMHFLLLNLLPMRLIRLSKNPAFSAASGQFMFFKADNYREYQWHEQVKNKVVEDIEIMKLVKTCSLNGEALLANGYISCRMYKSFDEAVDGFSKNLLAGFNNSIVGSIIYMFLVIGGPIIIFYHLGTMLLGFAIALIVLQRVMIALLSGQNALLNVLLHPFQMLALIWIFTVSTYKNATNSVTWKGRRINQNA